MNAISSHLYVCPKCKGVLQGEADHLRCTGCVRDYPIVNGIPDFLLVRPEESKNPFLHDIDKLGRWARLYDTPLWYPLVLSIHAEHTQHIQEIPESDLFEPGRYAWQGKISIVETVLANTANHYRWANSKIRAWLEYPGISS